ncbi:MAG: DUF4012 domain-containing protein, partial [Candidatus Doudnabacteria bacterium]|nr:DUF4012 domain-containing protein [Candidatus Doudnabacteria bacterium]
MDSESKPKKMDQFKLVRKLVPIKAKPVIKREVTPRDILVLNKKLPQQNLIETGNDRNINFLSPSERIQPDKVRNKQPRTSFKALIPAVSICLLIVLVLQTVAYLNTAKSATGIVLGAATSAYDDLDAANKSLEERDFGSAKIKFTSAQHSLAEAQSALDKFKVLLAVAPPARSADDVLTGAYFLAEAGKNLTNAMQLFDQLSVDSNGIATDNFTTKLEQNRSLLKNSLMMLSYAEDKFESAKNLPGEYGETVKQAGLQISLLNGVLKDLVDLEDLFLSFFGVHPKTYLIVFQNYDEMRATGGFIGTYGVLKYENGAIKKLKIESIYNLDGSLNKRIAAPGPFQPQIEKWGMRDSNWFADFPTTAEKLLSFFEMSSETADGVIALTPNIFVEILKLIGPVFSS